MDPVDAQTLKVLQRQRQRQQDEALKKWSQAQSVTARSLAVAAQLRNAQTSAQLVQGVSLSSASLQVRQGFGRRLHDVCSEAANRIDAARRAEDRRQQQFREARRESLVIEKLQERARALRAQAQRKAEQTMLEDFVASRHGA